MTKLKNMRRKKKMLLRDIANVIGVTPQTVQQMSNTGIKKVATAKRYAKALDCDWRDLLD